MNHRMIAYLFGTILLIESALLVVPMLTALLYGESILPFLYTILLILAFALPFVLHKPKNKRIYGRDGFVCVAGSWIIMSVFGALPFVFSGVIPNFVDAFFETVSGFTTTGATVMTEIEGFLDGYHGILFWRNFTHWIGGMGVLVFMIAILPSENGQAVHLLHAETTGPTKGKLVPKVQQTAIILYLIYLFLSVLQTVLLCVAGLSLYDSLVTAFATAGTGGFSVKNLSIAGYHNPAVEWITGIFMLLFGINFNLYFFLLMRRFRDVYRNSELRAYLAICVGSVAIIAVNTWVHARAIYDSVGDCIRASFFQVTTIVSTTGFSTLNYDALWPELSKSILLVLMLIGSCAGSTAGGLKVSRVMMLFKSMARQVKHIIRPRSVNVVRSDGEVVPVETLHRATNYLSIYFSIIVLTTLLLAIDGKSLETNLTATLACVNNIGPGLGEVGPIGNFAGFSVFSKLLLSLNMLFGRLELLPVLIFLSPSAWRKR